MAVAEGNIPQIRKPWWCLSSLACEKCNEFGMLRDFTELRGLERTSGVHPPAKGCPLEFPTSAA